MIVSCPEAPKGFVSLTVPHSQCCPNSWSKAFTPLCSITFWEIQFLPGPPMACWAKSIDSCRLKCSRGHPASWLQRKAFHFSGLGKSQVLLFFACLFAAVRWSITAWNQNCSDQEVPRVCSCHRHPRRIYHYTNVGWSQVCTWRPSFRRNSWTWSLDGCWWRVSTSINVDQ